MSNHLTIGVYPDGSHKHNVVAPEDLGYHLEYNKMFRPGRALFLDGVLVQEGFVDADVLQKWEKDFQTYKVPMDKPTIPYR
jgi:hypothetical protein